MYTSKKIKKKISNTTFRKQSYGGISDHTPIKIRDRKYYHKESEEYFYVKYC